MKTRKASLAVAVFFVSLATGGNALAANEWWPMMMNCWQDAEAVPYLDESEWASNEYGYSNLVDEAQVDTTLDLYCHQLNIVENAGHDGGWAYVYDRHPDDDVILYLCRNNGAGSELCEQKATTGSSFEYKTLTFSSTADARGYIYWYALIPQQGPSGATSRLTALLLKDN